MKIAIVTSTFPPYSGGVGNVAAWNARELAKLGHAVTVFTPAYAPVTETVREVPVVRLRPRMIYGNAAFVPQLGTVLRGQDIVHLHYPFFGGAEPIWWSARGLRKSGAKIVVHYHMDVVGRGVIRHIFSAHRRWLLPRILRMADRVVVTSTDYARHSPVLGPVLAATPERCVEVPNGVNVEHFRPEVETGPLEVRLKLAQDERVVLFVGGLDRAHYFKGVAYLLKAMSGLREAAYRWKLVIVGSGDLMGMYQAEAQELGIGALTEFAGHVPFAELPMYFRRATVTVLPSVDATEAFGMVLIESMACGRPVIATNLPGVRSVVDQEKNGLLVNVCDAGDLAKAIGRVCADPAMATQWGEAGMRKVRERYDWRMIARQLEAMYLSL